MAFHQYNKQQYNTAQYNADASTWVIRNTESVASADARIESIGKVLADSLSSADARIYLLTRALQEFTFLTDTIVKSVSNKGLSETIRVNDWVEIDRKSNDNGNGWS